MATLRLSSNDITYIFETGTKGLTLATQTMPCTPAEAVADNPEDVRYSTDEAVEARMRTMMASPRLMVAMTAAPNPPAEIPQ